MINIYNDFAYEINEKEIRKYIKYLKKSMKVKKGFSLVFVDNQYIKKLNKEYRDKDYATDVLTFNDEDKKYLGDVIISYPKIIEQAEEYNHSFKRELYFLITHGFLHLLGYDHIDEYEEKEMFKIQKDLLNNYKIRRENE